VLINPVEMKPNPAASKAVWDTFETLPSQTRPQRGAKPAKRLTALAHELASDRILKGAGKLAHAAMHKVLDAAQEKYKSQIDVKRNAVMTVDGQTVVANLRARTRSFNQFLEDADMAVIDDAYRRAARTFSPDISRTYVEELASRAADPEDADEFEEALVEGRVSVAALGLVTEVQPYFDSEADKLAKAWLEKHNAAIKKLSHDRQESYRQIREMSAEPQNVDLVKPEARFEPTKARVNDIETELPTYKNHLLCDERGNYSAELNSWEAKVVEAEMRREENRCWYRNPQQPGQSSLGIAYLSGEEFGIVRPDFIFFATQADQSVVVDIVDPHGLHLADALPKLQGLALYAEKQAKVYRRIDSVAEAKGKLRVLDLKKEDVRKGIAAAKDATSLFSGPLARDF
jgi:type III restriction enzyme